jgi:anthranilate phosphoribosyltransferase
MHALQAVLQGIDLTRAEASEVMLAMITGEMKPEQIGALLLALRLKTESVDEITGFVHALRSHATPVQLSIANAIDVCGTGGDGLGTFNVSTTASFVIAAAGQPIAKHGNRSVSSRCGSFDVLEALGLRFLESAAAVNQEMETFGIAFMFAPAFHPTLKNVMQLRKSLGVRTVFNLLGPLLNPAGVKRQLIGVYEQSLVERVAEVLGELGTEEAMIVRGLDGLDEISLCAPTEVAHLRDGRVQMYQICPEDFGMSRADHSYLIGGDAQDNAAILVRILAGERGPRRDLVLLNSAAALLVGGHAENFKDGLAQAAAAIDSGRALILLKRMQVSE